MSVIPEPTAAVRAAHRAPRRALWRRRGFWLALAIAGCLAGGAVQHYYRRHHNAGALRVPLEELDRADPGWRLADLEAARATLPDSDNAAICVAQVSDLLPKITDPLPALHVRFDLRVRLEHLQPNERPSADDLARLREYLRNNASARNKAVELADLPRGRYAFVYKRDKLWPSAGAHYHDPGQVALLLSDDAMVQADDGHMRAALRSCRAALNVGRSVGDEPFDYAQTVRVALVNGACQGIERVLAQGEPDADDLRDLQTLLDDEARFPHLLVMARAGRAFTHEILDAVEVGDVPLADLVKWLDAGSHAERNLFFYSEAAVCADHRALLQTLTEAVEIARLPPPERGPRIDAYTAAVKAALPDNLLYRLVPNLRGMNDRCNRAEARLRCLQSALAVERYRQRHGTWPEALCDLTPDWLAEVPTDPADGEPLGYRRYADRIVVYSRLIAPTGPAVEPAPSGAFAAEGPSPPGVGVAVHLFDVKHRRQPPGPPPPGIGIPVQP